MLKLIPAFGGDEGAGLISLVLFIESVDILKEAGSIVGVSKSSVDAKIGSPNLIGVETISSSTAFVGSSILAMLNSSMLFSLESTTSSSFTS